MKRLTSILLIICLVLAMVPTVLADSAIGGTTGDLSWTFDSASGVLSFEGTGVMGTYNKSNEVPWNSYAKSIKAVELPDGITTICSYAFYGCTALDHVVIPDSVTTIGKQAFNGCTGLLTVAIGNGVDTIGSLAFGNCGALLGLSIGRLVDTIEINAFPVSTSLKYVVFNGSEAAWNDVTVNSGNSSIKDKVECLSAPATGSSKDVTWTFDHMTFTLTISGEGEMDDYSFSNPVPWDTYKDVVRTLVVEEGVTTIGELALRYCKNLKTAQLPATLTTVDAKAFERCDKLTDVYYGSTEDAWESVAIGSDNEDLIGAAFHYAGACAHSTTEPVYAPAENETHTVTMKCTTCGEQQGTVSSEDCVDEDADLLCDKCGGDLAAPCAHENTSKHYYSEDDGATHRYFLMCGDCAAKVDEGKENCTDDNADGACDHCAQTLSGSGSGEGGEGDDDACQHENTETACVCNGNETHTTTVTCTNEACGEIVSTETADCTDTDMNNVCESCGGDVQAIYYTLTNGVLTIFGKGPMEDYASFTSMPWSPSRNNVTEIIIEEGVTHIGARSFYRCVNVKKVTIASSVKSIGDSAFYRCDALNTVVYGGSQNQWEALVGQTGSNNTKLTGASTILVVCDHATTTKTIVSNAEEKTHTITETCTNANCGEIASTETVACAGEAVYTASEDGKHIATVNCAVCKQLVSEEEIECSGTSVTVSNGDRTHTITTTCDDCKAVLSDETVKCTDAEDDEDELCDICEADLHCDHKTYVRDYNSNGDHKTHTYAYNCEVCGIEIDPIRDEACASVVEGSYDCDKCGQDFSCQHDEEDPIISYEYIVNDDRTHTVITVTTCANPYCDVKELLRETAEETTKCTDENKDDYCDVCEADLTCLHDVYEVKYVCNKNWTHQMQIICTICDAMLTDTTETCVNRSGNDQLCDKCAGACEHSYEVSYELLTGEKHTKVETCEYEGCGKVVKTEEACADTIHDSKCDACGNDVACAHIGKTEHVAKEDETHDIVMTCTVCGDETDCEKCLDYIQDTVNEPCTDENHDQKCDDCGDTVECKHDGENTYEAKDDGTHKIVCGYCGETVETKDCVNETGNDLKCDDCGYNFAIATTGDADFMTIAEAVTAVKENGTVTLLKDVELPAPLTISKSMTLDLGGKTLTIDLSSTAIEVSTGSVSVCNGTIDSVNSVFRLVSGELELLDDLEVTSDNGYVVYVKGGMLSTEAVLSASGSNATITGNGLYAGDAEILGGSVTHTSDIAISWPQNGQLTITGGTITGATALYVKGGEVEISGDAKLIANGEKADFVHGNNGAYSTGDALVVENSDYPAAPPVVTVTGGIFTSQNGAAAALYGSREDGKEVDPFIAGGTYSSDVSELCVDGYVCVKSGDVYVVEEEGVQIEKIDITGSNMTLGNELILNFVFRKTAFAGRDDLTFKATITSGEEVVDVREIAIGDWGSANVSYYKVSVAVSAKQMTDVVSIEIVDEDGNVYNNPYSMSVREYGHRILAADQSEATKIVVVDMLNYGAAAQTNFGYATEDLANSQLTEEQAALATTSQTLSNNQVKGTNFYASNLTLEDCILMNQYFTLKDYDISTLHGEITFTDNQGAQKTVPVTADEILLYNAKNNIYKVCVDDIVLADAKCLVTVTIYDAQDNAIAWGTDSVESIAYRGSEASTTSANLRAVYDYIMRFAASAYVYVGGTN